MKHSERQDLTEKLFAKCIEMGNKKNKSYAGQGDTLANFKRNAEALGLTKYQIWLVYFNKHIDSINNAIKDNPELPVDASESIEGRVIDVIVYATILHALIHEDTENDKQLNTD